MSVFGSLFTAVSGLTAQGQSLGMISNNIANVSTVGYKKTDAAFSSLVTSASRSTLYSPGSVKATQNQRVDLQGILQQSASATDLAISGNGMFVVKSSTTDPAAETLFSRAGSFTEDQNGNLKNTSGFNLYGWPLDQNGAVIGSLTSLSSLVPVNVAFPGGLAQSTANAALDANLDATQNVNANPSDFSRDITVYDSLGNAHAITASFKKHDSTTATATGDVDLSTQTANFAPGTDSFDVDVGAGPTTITLDGNVNKLLTDLNAVPGVSAHLDASGHLVIAASTIGNTLTLADNSGTPLASDTIGLANGTTGVPTAETPIAGTTLSGAENATGWWDVTYSSDTGTLASGSINFNSDGSLNATKATDGTVNVGLGPINWGNGSVAQSINYDIGGLTQFSGDYNVSSATQNGTGLGFRTGVSVDNDGVVSCQFSNGLSRQVYKLGVATFADPDGLTQLSGNVYRVSDTSGQALLEQANKGGAGTIDGGALEQSNVDLADEFSKMIITQRAYTANTKVISTADQMTQDLLQLR